MPRAARIQILGVLAALTLDKGELERAASAPRGPGAMMGQ